MLSVLWYLEYSFLKPCYIVFRYIHLLALCSSYFYPVLNVLPSANAGTATTTWTSFFWSYLVLSCLPVYLTVTWLSYFWSCNHILTFLFLVLTLQLDFSMSGLINYDSTFLFLVSQWLDPTISVLVTTNWLSCNWWCLNNLSNLLSLVFRTSSSLIWWAHED